MILVGIDIAKDKHDCFIRTLDGEVLWKPFTITNTISGFDLLTIIKNNENCSLFGFFITKKDAEKYMYIGNNGLFSIKT